MERLSKKAMTLTLSDSEMELLENLSARKEMTKTAVIRQAIKLYKLVDDKLGDGAKLFLEDVSGKESELMVL
jgi:predicted transcriptional regulator